MTKTGKNMNDNQQPSLLPERHPTPDFFIADIFDSLPFKDDLASMAHPVFSLSKKTDMRELEYSSGDITLSIIPSTRGLPTIFDKDVLLYCGSLLMNEINEGRIPSKTLRISSHDLLVATNRRTSGPGYTLLKKALDRLRGVTIKTNIKTNKREITRAFGLIESYEIIESSRVKDRMIRLEVTLSDWYYNSILGKEVLTISRDYFRLGKPLERRLYEIARKFCGQNSEWSISLDKLKERTGSTSSLVKFRFFIKEQAKFNHLPDYEILLNDKDIVTFKRRNNGEAICFDDIPAIKPETIEKGRKIVEEAGTGWDYDEIREQFHYQVLNGFKPEKMDGAFIAFVKKKTQEMP
jgi:hypothetical protein